jgi:hypothetical protein
MNRSKGFFQTYMRPLTQKKFTLLIGGGVLAVSILVLFKNEDKEPHTNQSESLSPEQDEISKVFLEASKKRFGIKKAPVLNLTADEESSAQIKDTLTREVMIGKLISEALDHKPHLITLSKERTLQKNPKILSLTQKVNEEVYQSHFIVSNTTKCQEAYDQPTPKVLPLKEIFKTYCVDPNFDYPGGFDEKSEVEVKISSIDDVNHFEGLDHELDKLIKIQLRSVIMDDFTKQYQETGKLSYVD